MLLSIHNAMILRYIHLLYTKNGTTECKEISPSNFDHSPCPLTQLSWDLIGICMVVVAIFSGMDVTNFISKAPIDFRS